jgi:predicted amidohydrolase
MKIKVAAVQMWATPYELEANLAKAAQYIAAAAEQGAKLVVLPELFNSGYRYDERNFKAAEPLEGQTVQWMREQAARHELYLTGTLLTQEGGDVYDTMPLVAPDGVLQIYRKVHPFMWEYCYFRAGAGPLIARTPWGRWGMLVCWDMLYRELAEAYRGKVDLLVVCSAPPMLPEGNLIYPDGETVPFAQVNMAVNQVRSQARRWYYEDVGQLARWAGAATVHAVMSGTFQSPIPMSRPGLLLSALGRPRALRHLLRKEMPTMVAPFGAHSAIFSREGEALAVLPDGEGVIAAEVDAGREEER